MGKLKIKMFSGELKEVEKNVNDFFSKNAIGTIEIKYIKQSLASNGFIISIVYMVFE